MQQYLLPDAENEYKANLHCHSTVSDGRLTPDEIKRAYVEHGYSIVAFTDHDVLIPHTELQDEKFLPLSGYEIEITETDDRPFNEKKTCHLCLISPIPVPERQVCWHRSKYMIGHSGDYREMVRFDENIPDYERSYDYACVNDIIAKARNAGFFVTYNHPVWSLENYADYINYNGMNAMEICNYSCIRAGYDEHNARVYDEMLRSGKRLFCIAADDNHDFITPSEPYKLYRDSFGGFTVIKAKSLEYSEVFKALQNGSFYASEGPSINSITFDDGIIYVTCPEARSIVFTTGKRRTKQFGGDNDDILTGASFRVKPDDGYIRVTVTDARGNKAYSNAYFTDKLFPQQNNT